MPPTTQKMQRRGRKAAGQFAATLAKMAAKLRDRAAELLSRKSDGRGLRGIHDDVQRLTGLFLTGGEFADAYAQTLVVGLLAVRFVEEEGTALNVHLAVVRGSPLVRRLLAPLQKDACTAANDLKNLHADLIEIQTFLQDVDVAAQLAKHVHGRPNEDPLVHFYEGFLAEYDVAHRKRRGVYYTPRPVVSFIVRSIDDVLRTRFGLEDGLADTTTWARWQRRRHNVKLPRGATAQTPLVQILDPAVGTGTFLVEVIDAIHRTTVARWKSKGCHVSEIAARWNEYVPRDLLPRLYGFEVMMPPLVLAHFQVARKLAETGYAPITPDDHADSNGDSDGPGVNVFLANTLRRPPGDLDFEDDETALDREASRARAARTRVPMTIVVGNPPFSGISSNMNPWIDLLLKGRSEDDPAGRSYYRIDGRPRGEKKLWLQDDYVKVFRYAQWRCVTSGCGVLGFVSNHGYIDNPTFRGMRQSLAGTFPEITIVDLHGNRKKRECSPSGGADENVFLAEQGVAVGIMSRPTETSNHDAVRFGELWGKREEKCRRLEDAQLGDVASAPIELAPPFYFFVPRDQTHAAEYERGFRLPDVMPVCTTAPVTARDRFVVAMDEGELVERMVRFRDLSIPDDVLREEYFGRTRSSKYPQGDSRGWKLAAARRIAARDADWRQRIVDCLYRPFDRRKIFWAPWMVDWPRPEVTRHLTAGPNVALIARRQMLPTQPCNYFWIADAIPIDGVIRSDNRGSESVFPLYTYPGPALESREVAASSREGEAPAEPNARDAPTTTARREPRPPRREANFAADFVEQAAHALKLQWVAQGQGDLQTTFGPEDLLHFIYATFHWPTYRTRYADQLRVDFPRVFLTANRELFRELCGLGSRLAALHLSVVDEPSGQGDVDDVEPPTHRVVFRTRGENHIGKGYPRFEKGRVLINKSQWFEPIAEYVWNFRVGGHQVCLKWLKDRRGRRLAPAEISQYCQMGTSLAETIRLTGAIDRVIQSHGGFAGELR